jgi:hypothetical protein
MTRLGIGALALLLLRPALADIEAQEIFTHQFLGGNPGVIQSAGDYVLIPSPGETLGFWSTAGDADTAVRVSIVAPEGEPYQALRFEGSQQIRTAERYYFGVQRSISSAPIDIWVTDGTQAGTYRIVDTQAIGLSNSAPSVRYFAKFNDTVAFVATAADLGEERLFIIDESAPDNVIMVPDLRPYIGQTGDRMRQLGPYLYVSSTAEGDRSLWRVSAETHTATQVWSMGGTSTERLAPSSLMTAGGVLYFRARDDVNEVALWRLNETGTDARKLHDPAPDPLEDGAFRGSARLIAADQRLYFFARQLDTTDPDTPFWRNDYRLATSQGTEATTASWWREQLGSGWNGDTMLNDEFGVAGSSLIFKSPPSADGGRRWWRTSGTEASTQPIFIDDEAIPAPGQTSGTGEGIAQDENGVWVSDVQGLGVRRRIFFIGPTDAESFAVPGEFNRVNNFHAHNGRFWFTVQAPVGGNRSVWRICPDCQGDSIFSDRFNEGSGD